MSDTTLRAIMGEIEKHQTKLKKLEERRKELELELPMVRANLEALTRSLTILRGEDIPINKEEQKEEPTLLPVEKKQPFLREGSNSYIAYSILKSGPSLTGSELFEAVKAKKPELNKNSFLSGIYTFIRKKKYFKKDGRKISISK